MTRSILSRIARDSYQVNRAARVARAYQTGGLPKVARQQARRVLTRRLFRALGR